MEIILIIQHELKVNIKRKIDFKFILTNLEFIPKYELSCFTIPSNLWHAIIFSDSLT